MEDDKPERHRFVSVIVDGVERHFKLTRYTLAGSLKHLRIMETAWNAAQAECESKIGDPLSQTLSSNAYLQAVAPRVVALLQEPADFGGPLTTEEFWKLDPADHSKVLAAQEELSSLENLIANGQMFGDIARQRAADKILNELSQEGAKK